MLRKSLRMLLVIFLAGLTSACNSEKLLENLTQEQANQVLSILQQHNISAQKNGSLKEGYAISVSEYENTTAISIISQYQLPWSGDIQIGQAFPDSALVASPNAEQARVLSLIEQRLGQSLRIITQVVNARVHISYPGFRNEMSNKAVANHVGVLISYKGEIDENLFISQIKSLIKNSLNDVLYENISVVLFDAPVIQYSSPTNVSSPGTDTWIILLAILIFIAIASLAFYLYQHSRRSTVDHTEQNNQSKSEDFPDNAP